MGKSKAGKTPEDVVNQDLQQRYDDKMGRTGNPNPLKDYADNQEVERDKARERADEMYGNLRSRFGNLADTGGMDANNRNRLRGNGVYDEFSKTGGYSENDKANIRSRATAVIPGMYDSYRTEAERLNKVQGGLNPGFTSQMALLGREKARAANDAAADAEFNISDRVRQGRQWGTQGMTDAEARLLGIESSNRNVGLQGLENLYTSKPGEVDMYDDRLLRSLGMSEEQIDQLLRMKFEAAHAEPSDEEQDKETGRSLIAAGGGLMGTGLLSGGSRSGSSKWGGGGW